MLTTEAETEVQRMIDNICKEKLTKHVPNMHKDRNVNMVRPVNLYIKESAKYGQCRFGQRCNISHDLEGRCKREQ